MEPFVCFLILVFMSTFLIFASQHSELTLSQSGAQRQDIKGKERKLMTATEALSTWLQRAPDWDSVYLQNLSVKTTSA
jgi:hypothetical protein